MNIYQVRDEIKHGKTIYDIPLKVVYYARVSTLSDGQQTSIENQQDYYHQFITNNKNWTLVNEYIDHGISGMHVETREEFQRMMTDAKNGKFDLIITKEIARFARNTLDSIKYTRELLQQGVAVWFQTDSINTIDEDSELRLAIMSSLAQDELRKLSNRVKFGQAQAIKKGHVLGTNNMYGYVKKDCKLQIVEEEAKMIRKIFELYASGEWTTPKIEKYLYDNGYRNSKGGQINRRVIGNIIQNPKYKGYFAGGKVKIVDMFSKKQAFIPEDKWTMFKAETGEVVPAIVDEVLWERANKIFRERGNTIKSRLSSYNSQNLYTGKIICGLDGQHYWKNSRKYPNGKITYTWVCRNKRQMYGGQCNSFPIKETELNRMFAMLLNDYVGNIDKIKEQYIAAFKKISQSNQYEESKEKLLKNINDISAKKDKLLDMMLDGLINKTDFQVKNQSLQSQYEKLQEELNVLHKRCLPEHEFSVKLNHILNILKEYDGIRPEEITRPVVEKLIDKIVITPTDKQHATIEFCLKDGKIVNGYVMGKSENMVLNMFTEHILYTDRDRGLYKRIKYPVQLNYHFCI